MQDLPLQVHSTSGLTKHNKFIFIASVVILEQGTQIGQERTFRR